MKHVPVAAFLISRGASVNAKSVNGWTPLIEAARVGSVELVRLLLHQKRERVDVNASNKMGWTALMEACRTAHFSTVRCLIVEGHARIDLKDHVRYLARVCECGIAAMEFDMWPLLDNRRA